MTNPLRQPLEGILAALSGLTVRSTPIVSLDTALGTAVNEAEQALAVVQEPPDADVAMDMAIKAAIEKGHLPDLHPDVTEFGRAVIREYLTLKTPKLEDDYAYCIGCGTHPKGAYTCATCIAADEHEGPQPFVSDWPPQP